MPAAAIASPSRAVRLSGVLALTAVLVAGCGTASRPTASPAAPAGSGRAAQAPPAGMAPAGPASEPPAVYAWYAGQDIRFAHTEVSDRKLAELLTGKKGSPVIYVPGLAKVPAEATSPVYIFANGVQPGHQGPLGFQGDVFPTAPGDPSYSPLRALNLVSWKNPAAARELKAASDVLAARKNGELTVTTPGAVINMPFLQWPTGHR